MSKTVKIPDIGANPFIVRVGLKQYSYPAGSTQTVPDPVAAVIENYYELAPKERPAASQGETLPAVSATDNGKVLGVSGGKWGAVAAPSGLPTVSGSDNGKILGVSAGSWEKIDAPSGLPAVTGDDNGKVLGVSSGSWAAVDAGQQVIRVPFTLTMAQDRDGMDASTTADFSEVYEAFVAGAVIVADASFDMGIAVTHICGVMSGSVGDGHESFVVCVTSQSLPGVYSVYYLSWNTSGVTATSANLQTQT